MKKEFDSKTITVLAIGLCVLMVLTFTAGVVTGIALWIPTRQELAELKGHTSAPPTLQASAIVPPRLPAIPVAAPAPAPAMAAAPPPATAEPPKAAETKPPAAEAPAPAPVVAAAPAADADVFSLQLGSFLKAENAKQLQTELKERGYNSTIFTALDDEQREWHVVRIPGFRTMSSASHAAASFTDKERMAAFVRRSNRL